MKPLSLIAALSVALAFASPAVAGPVPLKGTLAAVEIDDIQFPVMYVSGSGTGQSTHLGRYTMTFTATVDLSGPPSSGAPGIGTLELVAANGDKIFATFAGLGTFINADDRLSCGNRDHYRRNWTLRRRDRHLHDPTSRRPDDRPFLRLVQRDDVEPGSELSTSAAAARHRAMNTPRTPTLLAVVAAFSMAVRTASAGTVSLGPNPSYVPAAAFSNSTIQAYSLQSDLARASGDVTITPAPSSTVSIGFGGPFKTNGGDINSFAYSFVVDSNVSFPVQYRGRRKVERRWRRGHRRRRRYFSGAPRVPRRVRRAEAWES